MSRFPLTLAVCFGVVLSCLGAAPASAAVSVPASIEVALKTTAADMYWGWDGTGRVGDTASYAHSMSFDVSNVDAGVVVSDQPVLIVLGSPVNKRYCLFPFASGSPDAVALDEPVSVSATEPIPVSGDLAVSVESTLTPVEFGPSAASWAVGLGIGVALMCGCLAFLMIRAV